MNACTNSNKPYDQATTATLSSVQFSKVFGIVFYDSRCIFTCSDVSDCLILFHLFNHIFFRYFLGCYIHRF